MHRPSLALLGLFLTAPFPAAAQEAFQGAITYRMTDGGRSAEMTTMSRGTKARMEMAAEGMPGPMVILMDGEKQVVQVVMAQAGMYMEFDAKQAAQMAPTGGGEAAVTMEKLDTSEEIAGIRCQNYRIHEAGQPGMEACIATGMGYWMGGMAPPRNSRMPIRMGPDLSGLMKEFKDGMIPLRVRTQRGNDWTTVLEATAVTRKPIDAAMFEVPPGMRRMPMPGGGDR